MISDRIIVIISSSDIAGMNMLDFLLEASEYSKESISPPNTWPLGQYFVYKLTEFTILQIPESQIYTDYFKDYLDADLLIFASKHSSAAGQRALLVHTTGIWQKESGHGGNSHEIGYAPANVLEYAYKKIKERHSRTDLNYWIGIECTHHGPSSLAIPIMFIEAGGTIDEWSDKRACQLISNVILDTINAIHHNQIEEKVAFIGIGGNHYCSRFIKLLDQGEYSIGHIIPKYALPDLPIKVLEQAYTKTIAQNKIFLVDKKGARAVDRDKIIDFANKREIPWKYV